MIKTTFEIVNVLHWENEYRKIKRLARENNVSIVEFTLTAGIIFKDLEIVIRGKSEDVTRFFRQLGYDT